MKTLTQTSISRKIKTLDLKVSGSPQFVRKRVHRVAHLARVISKTIARREWVWEWATDKAVVTMSKTRVVVLTCYLQVVVQCIFYSRNPTTTTINRDHTRLKSTQLTTTWMQIIREKVSIQCLKRPQKLMNTVKILLAKRAVEVKVNTILMIQFTTGSTTNQMIIIFTIHFSFKMLATLLTTQVKRKRVTAIRVLRMARLTFRSNLKWNNNFKTQAKATSFSLNSFTWSRKRRRKKAKAIKNEIPLLLSIWDCRMRLEIT